MKTLSQSLRSFIRSLDKECLKRLSPQDRELKQIEFVVELAKMGIGIHHGGLLPLMKEMVEILFQRGLVRVLVATETLAVGLNMPARTVVFVDIKKHDGEGLRVLRAAEYTQVPKV
ncbi:DEAD/DEAH box helicase domain-containing protein, putative [Eimeria brunetti]|uniref:DEAD/DEAH box helicase domain-containing protein, putative n=1 Tax=Eimeria brunetti TaxID=51314 RepID=U6LJ90_9EIME|nr:DEAD/DEAH box helicase domain-containing protein, putative [Eimeria brunetti]